MNEGSPSARASERATSWRIAAPMLVVLFALAVRLQLLSITRDQPVLWDEAEYLLKAKSLALGTPSTGFFEGRPLGMPLAMAALYAVGFGELAVRVAILLSGVAAVYLVYRIGERLWSVNAGFVAAMLFSSHWIPLVYSMRVMTELPHVALALGAVNLLLSQRPWAVRLVGPLLVLAIYVRYTAGMMVLLLAIYVLSTEGRAAFRRRDHLWSAALALLAGAPFLARDVVRFGHPMGSWKMSGYLMPQLQLSDRWAGVMAYVQSMSSVGTYCIALLACGTLLALWDLRPRAARHARARSLLLLGWMVLPFVYFGGWVRGIETRYVVLALPAVFLLVGFAAHRGIAWLSELHPLLGPLVGALLLVTATPDLVRGGDKLVRSRARLQVELRTAGSWLAAHSGKDALLWTSSSPQITCYSERATAPLPHERAAFDAALREAPPRFVVLSTFEDMPAYVAAAAPLPDGVERQHALALLSYVWSSEAHQRALGLRPVAALPHERPRVFVFEPAVAASSVAASAP